MTDNLNETTEAVAIENSGKLPFRVKISYSCGAVSEVLMGNMFGALALAIYHLGLGVSAILIGLALSIPRFWDAVTDPIVANISDNCHTRFGRRKPFIISGTILSGIFCIMIWRPSLDMSEHALFAYFLILSLFYYTTYTVFGIPYHALGAELTSDYDERTNLMSYKTFFMGLGGTLLLPWAFRLCFYFGKNAPEGVNPEVIGVRTVGVLYAVVFIVFSVFPVLFCKERFANANRQKIPILPAMKKCVKNKQFLIVCMVTVSAVIGTLLAQPLGLFMNVAYVVPGDTKAAATLTGFYGTVYGIISMASVFLINYLGRHWEKKQTLCAGLILTLIGALLSWFVFNPNLPYLQLLHALVSAPGMTCLWLLTAVMIADVCDVDELKTGLRREAMYTAIFGWFMKCAAACTPAFAAIVLVWTGFDQKIGIQTEQTVLRMRLIFMLAPAISLFIAAGLIAFYKLNREKMGQIQAQLKENRKNRSE